MTDAGPLPAETRDFNVEAAGASVQPAFFAPKQPTLAWGFALTIKKGKAPKRVVVEEVFPTEVATVLVDDSKPVLQGTSWNGSSAGVDPTPASASWVFAEGATIFVVRFTITPEKGGPVILYQPVWYSAETKGLIRRSIGTIRGNG